MATSVMMLSERVPCTIYGHRSKSWKAFAIPKIGLQGAPASHSYQDRINEIRYVIRRPSPEAM
jgi:hypothetical protein